MMSKGIPTKPMTPRITSDGIIFGMTAIIAIEIDLKTIRKSTKIMLKTVKTVFI